MEIEVIKYPSPPKEDSPGNEGDPLVDTRAPPERDEYNDPGQAIRLCESCSFRVGIQMRLPKAFYEAAFQAGLRLPIYATLRRILAFYNICPTRLAPNAW